MKNFKYPERKESLMKTSLVKYNQSLTIVSTTRVVCIINLLEIILI